MSGILYGVGVGPGDPELMTLKAVRIIKENTYIAVPGEEAERSAAYKIAVQAIPELASDSKVIIPLSMPMVMDRKVMEENHRAGAEIIARYLEKGENVVFLTLGDPAVYSTYMYVAKYITARGLSTEIISGIPSFCAAAARMNVSLAEWDEELHIIPAVHGGEEGIEALMFEPPYPTSMDQLYTISPPYPTSVAKKGNFVFMKAGRKLTALKDCLRKTGKKAIMVENCGMIDEKVYTDLTDMPDKTGYFTLIIAKDI